MASNIYKRHPIQKCNGVNKAICVLLFLIFLLLFIVFGSAIYLYASNPGLVGAINNFPWMEASQDATQMYNSIKDFDTRGTLDNATASVNLIKKTIKGTNAPLKEFKDFIHAAYKDKDMFDKVNELLTKMYKPLKKFENGQDDIIELIQNVNKQLGNMQNNEIHKLASKIIQVINNIESMLTPDNMKAFMEAAKVFTKKLNQTDVSMFNKVLKETDFSMEKVNSIFKPL